MMPFWFWTVATFNPLTYLIDALRGLIIEQGQSNYSLVLDFGVMITVF